MRQLFPGPDGKPADVPARCAGVQCLRANRDLVAVFQTDGKVWLATGEQPAGRVAEANEPGLPEPPTPPPSPPTASATAPTLPPELRTCGQTFAGQGVGWHVIRNEGDVWQRIAWVVPPTDPAVLALPADAYPLARADGTLCGWGRQREERRWTIHHVASGRTVDAVENREHAPAHCQGKDGSLVVEVEDGVLVLAPDGSARREPTAEDKPLVQPVEFALDGTVQVNSPKKALRVRRADGTVQVLPLRDDVDIDDTALPAGTIRERVAAAGDGTGTLLVAERLVLPGCVVRERLFVVDLSAGRGRRLIDDDVMLMRLSFGAGRFFWVEAEPTYVDTSG